MIAENFQYLLQRRLGFNIETLLVSAHVSKADAFAEYLQRKKNTVTAGYEDQLSDRD